MIQQVSRYLQRYLPLIIFVDLLAAIAVGSWYPDLVHSLKPLIPYGMMLMLIPIMMGIAIRELKQIATDKKVILIAVLINFVLSPVIAYLWAELFFAGIDPGFIAGWILKLTVPCSGMMVAWTGLSGGKTETALIVQVLSFLVAIVAIPFWLTVLAGKFVVIDFWFIAQQIFWIIILPMIVGIGAREGLIIPKYGKEVFNKEIKPFLPPLSSIAMFFVIFVAVSGESVLILNNLNLFWILAASVFIVYPLLFLISIFVAKKSGLSYEYGIAIGFGTTAKNHGITLALATTTFGGLAVLPPSVVPMFQVLLMLGIWKLSPWVKRYFEKHKAPV
ncbi:MAG: bile acid:sodium symporter [Desulfovermiculus sp.]|nr:bile acid:sodium symporter [Desulfovermiculus sp.]